MNNAALSDPLDLLLRRFSFEFFQNLLHLAVILLVRNHLVSDNCQKGMKLPVLLNKF